MLVVDDSSAMRQLLKLALTDLPDVEVVGTASSGDLALRRIEFLRPDLITLDIEMPGLGGLETLSQIREDHPTIRVLIVSSLTKRGALVTLDALSRGASDYVSKPQVSSPEEGVLALRKELVPRIRSLCGPSEDLPRHVVEQARRTPTATWRIRSRRPEVIVVASSTGGPPALGKFLSGLPESFPCPILVVQHMPKVFTGPFAERLNSQMPLHVREAVAGAKPLAGQVWIAPGDSHLLLERGGDGLRLALSDAPQVNFCRPAADLLFESSADACPGQVLGVVLTGMGCDGSAGAARIREDGGRVLVQDEATSVVWGMPGNVARAGHASEILPLERLAARLVELAPRTCSLDT
ncbi:MAG: chemotaxis response regulator protein-glutamate methylesterase [Planctomycetes bacterium]|nr:chemotaxis response regulator protein-glutamate methylesterase [Planctomycetota bacterium]